jgi:hypothetical protein
MKPTTTIVKIKKVLEFLSLCLLADVSVSDPTFHASLALNVERIRFGTYTPAIVNAIPLKVAMYAPTKSRG